MAEKRRVSVYLSKEAEEGLHEMAMLYGLINASGPSVGRANVSALVEAIGNHELVYHPRPPSLKRQRLHYYSMRGDVGQAWDAWRDALATYWEERDRMEAEDERGQEEPEG